MKDREPPRLADWLLNRFHFVRRSPALTGDLLEVFRSGRSALWYWRQALVIVLQGACRNAYLFREYLGAHCLGWMLQAAVVLALCSRQWPAPRHGILWAVLAIAVWLLPPILVYEAKRKAFGGTSWSLQLLSRYDWAAMQNRNKLLALVCVKAFSDGLANYCAVSLFTQASLATWICIEAFYLAFDLWLVVALPESGFGKP